MEQLFRLHQHKMPRAQEMKRMKMKTWRETRGDAAQCNVKTSRVMEHTSKWRLMACIAAKRVAQGAAARMRVQSSMMMGFSWCREAGGDDTGLVVLKIAFFHSFRAVFFGQ